MQLFIIAVRISSQFGTQIIISLPPAQLFEWHGCMYIFSIKACCNAHWNNLKKALKSLLFSKVDFFFGKHYL